MRILVLKPVRKTATHKSDSGAALVVVLVLLVLMLGVVLAFFSQSILQKQVSKNSAAGASADILAEGAINTTVGDLISEIALPANNSLILTANGIDLYRAKPANIMPSRTGTTDTFPNLIKKSVAGGDFGAGVTSRAAAAATKDLSLNGRSITNERWNKPLLFPDASVQSFVSPDWIFVSRNGKNPISWATGLKWDQKFSGSNDSVVGRYAFTIYNEGGLLDANAVGFPAAIKTSPAAQDILDQTKYKTSLAYADLTVLPGFDQGAIEKMVKWRNAATLNGTTGTPSSNFFSFGSRNANNFITAADTTAATAVTDHVFVGRQQLIDFFNNQLGATYKPVLQYLGTFSRTLNQPSYWPPAGRPKVLNTAPTTGSPSNGNSAYQHDDDFNPAFLTVRAATGFKRADGSIAVPQEPLVKKRFALDRLCWLTYKGPSANLPVGDKAYTALIDSGVSPDTIKRGTTENIKSYFGLTWTGGSGPGQIGGYWTYEHGIGSASQTGIGTLDEVALQNRDADFFELLKAAINAGSLGRPAPANVNYPGNTGTYQTVSDSRVNTQIFQIGANIIDSANPTGYPTEIRYGDGQVTVGGGGTIQTVSVTRKIFGNQDLPYLSSLDNIAFVVNPAGPAPAGNDDAKPVYPAMIPAPAEGLGVALAVPSIWNSNGYKSGTTKVLANELIPSDLRITVSTIPVVGPQTYNSSFDCLTFPRYSLGAAPPAPPVPGPTPVPVNDINHDPLIRTSWTNDDINALEFKNDQTLYREPTALVRAGFPAGSDLKPGTGSRLSTLGWASGIPESGGSPSKLVGFFFSQFPLRWNRVNPNDQDPTHPTPRNWTFTTNAVGLQPLGGYTVRLEYKAGSSWVPYKEYYFNGQFVPIICPVVQNGGTYPYVWPQASGSPSIWNGATSQNGRGYGNGSIQPIPSGNMTWDPRSIRWGLLADNWARPVLDANQSMTTTYRPDGKVEPSPFSSAIYNFTHGTKPAGITQNNMGINDNVFPYGDPDSVPRKAMGAYVIGTGASPTVGLPMATTISGAGFTTTADQWQSRPVILHRPYRSVAELGYVFRDTPWKNIDFFTPESGDAALLDVFCVHEDIRPDALTAGKVDLNTRQPLVIQSILTGAYRDTFGTDDITSIATTLATKLTDRTKSTDVDKGALGNLGDLVGRWTSGTGAAAKYYGFINDLPTSVGPIQRYREAAIRALADTGQVGTWNLMIDMIVQAGRYPANASGFKDFYVEAEKRLWVHVSINRQTGKVVDQQIEEVSE